MIDTVVDSAQRARLARMKMLATGLLIAMALLFLAARSMEATIGWLGFIRAFAEAAMIGALADWFAVTALFKYPLGLPIPHTAIIPRQKDRIGESLARFVKEHFLVADALRPKLQTLDFSGRMGAWIRRSDNAKRLTGDAGAFTAWFLDSLDNTELRHFLRENLNLISSAASQEEIAARVSLAAGALKDMSESVVVLRDEMKKLVESESEAVTSLRGEYQSAVANIREQNLAMKSELERFRSVTSQTQDALIELAKALKEAV